MKKVINSYGTEVNYNAALMIMDDELREEIHEELSPCTDQEFFEEYAKRHEEKFGEEWEADKLNPMM